MRAATKGMPAQDLQTDLALPEGGGEPDAETYGLSPDGEPLLGPDGQPLPPADPAAQPGAQQPGGQPRLDGEWLDGVIKDTPEPASQGPANPVK
jgi:hypothetical protein